jgi:hypothetical protein
MVLMHDHLQLRDSVGISPTSLPRGISTLPHLHRATTKNFHLATYCGPMDGPPKRSRKETVGQLLVIAILIGILIGAVLLLRQYVDSHNANQSISTTATLNFKCCTAFHHAEVNHPSEATQLTWTPVEALPGQYPARTITITGGTIITVRR